MDAAGPLGFENLAAHKRAHGNNDAIVLGDGVGSLEINGITGLSGPSVDAIPQQ